ncbi:hypothetical protein [Paenibacillus sp. FSL R7-0333]|uniref:hypothetical protein n=1 Tax=Paenibacillus sp. FSL R7-0333 TaxID=1926587 RepID=UPI00117F32AF
MTKRKKSVNKKIILIAFGILLHLIILVPFGSIVLQNDTVLRTLRYISYLLFVGMFARNYFDVQLGMKLLKYISVFSSVFLIIQFILLNNANYYLSGFIPGLPLSIESMHELGRQYILGFARRPTSIFQEPAHFASYVLLYFGIALFSDNKKDKFGLIVIGIALILSGSSTGILIAIGLVVLWLGRLLKQVNDIKKVINIFMIILFLMICFWMFTKTQIFNSFMDRTFASKTATTGRFGNYVDVFSNPYLNKVERIFGHGMVRFEEYIPTIPRIYFYFGTSGLFLFILYSLKTFLKKQGYSRVSLLILLVSTLGTEIAFGSFIVMYLSFIIETKKLVRVEEDNIAFLN